MLFKSVLFALPFMSIISIKLRNKTNYKLGRIRLHKQTWVTPLIKRGLEQVSFFQKI